MEKDPCQPSIELNDLIKIKKVIEWLRIKQSWKSDVPSQILNGASKEKNYKVRKNWWAGLACDLDYLSPILERLGNTDLIADISQFQSFLSNSDFGNRLTTKEDIELADKLIEKILSYLENLQNFT